MRYLHTLDPDELRDLEDEYWKDVAELDPDELRDLEDEYWKDVAELEAEDAAMERYYEEKYNR